VGSRPILAVLALLAALGTGFSAYRDLHRAVRPAAVAPPPAPLLFASRLAGPAPWGFDRVAGEPTPVRVGRRTALRFAPSPGEPAFVQVDLIPRRELVGRFALRVQHAPPSGSTIVLALLVTGGHGGMYVKLDRFARLTLVDAAGTVAGRTPLGLVAGRRYVVTWRFRAATRTSPFDGVDALRVATAGGLPVGEVATASADNTAGRSRAAAAAVRFGIADRAPFRRAVTLSDIVLGRARPPAG
jgi:hypothetical protein